MGGRQVIHLLPPGKGWSRPPRSPDIPLASLWAMLCPSAWPKWPCGTRPIPPFHAPESCCSGFAFLPLLRAAAKLVERGLHLLKRSGLPGGIGLARDDDRGCNEHGGPAEGQGELRMGP